METQQNDIFKSIEPLIDNFCKIILTDNDCFNHKQAEEYIDNLTDSNKSDLNFIKEDANKKIQNIALIQIINYLQGFHTSTIGSPFQFDSGMNFLQYRAHFEKYYAEKNNNADVPYVFKVVFDYIQSTSDHYRIFEQFYNVRAIETSDTILTKTQIQAENAVKKGVEKAAEEAALKAAESAVKKINNVTQEAVSQATNKAEAYAQAASESAQNAMKEASTAAKMAAEEETNKVIDLKMTEVTKHISESSVTILGIFSGIVLTVVAGLFYSSSVLESVAKTNFFKLMFISALVGLVCFGLIVVMFRFIEKISGKTDSQFLSDNIVLWITTILCIIMALGLGLHLSNLDRNNEADEFTTEASTCVCFEEESTTE